MIITNKQGLPAAIVKAVEGDYTTKENVFRVTELMKDVREILLMRRHGDKIEIDVSDMGWSILGTAMHKLIEDSQEADDEFKEVRISKEFGKFKVSGKFDMYSASRRTVYDWKSLKTWKWIYQNFDDWQKQIHMYAYLLTDAGFPCDKGVVTGIFKDYNLTKKKLTPDYPAHSIMKKTFYINNIEAVENEIREKLDLLSLCLDIPDHELPLCSEKARFNDGKKYAVMNGKKKRAARVLDTKQEATDYCKKDENYWIEERPGIDKKCLDYCLVKDYCDYYTKNYGGKK